jgi:hypothetical protein
MIRIRDEQMEALRRAGLKRFQTAMLIHLRSCMPSQTSVLSDEELLTTIETGISRAGSYGVILEFDVQRFLECTIKYGSDFDRDPAYAWAGEILHGPKDGTAKINTISDYELFVLRIQL